MKGTGVIMNLNMNLIADMIREDFSIIKEDIKNEELTLEQVKVFTDDIDFMPGIIYIAYGKELPQKLFYRGFCSFIMVGECPKCYMDSECDYIEVDEKYSVFEILNCVQDIFKLYNKWHLDMYEALANEEGVQVLLDLTFPLLENPIYLHDTNYHFIAYSKIPGLPGGNSVHSIEERSDKLSLEGIKAIKRTPYFEDTLTTKKPTFHTNVGEVSYIYDNLWLKEQFWGRIFVDERIRSFKKSDYVIIGVLRKMIEKVLFRRNLIPGKRYRFLEQKMIDMLEGKSIDDDELEKELKLRNWTGNEGSYFCFTLQLKEIDILLNIMIRICEIIEKKIFDCITFPYEAEAVIIGIVHIDNKSKSLEKIKEDLKEFELNAGISHIFRDFKKFPLYYRQASIALKYGSKKNTDKLVHGFEEFCLDYMLDCCTEKLPADVLFPPELHKLIEHDRKKHSNYVETLRAYIENDLKPAKAMKALYIQRSTFLYRIDRISEMVGLDFEDEKVKLHFMLAFQLMDKIGATHDTDKSIGL